MKLSNREKVLIFVLIIVVFAYFGYKYIPTLGLFNLDALREEYSAKNNEYNSVSQNILMKNKYEENVQVLTEEIKNLNVISDLQQEMLIVFLNNYFEKNNIDVNNISFTNVVLSSISSVEATQESKELSTFDTIVNNINSSTSSEVNSNNTNDEDKDDANKSDEQSALSVRSISVNIAFESTYNNMINFIDAIQNNPVDISITNINTIAPGGNILQGTMTINFYEVPKPDGFVQDNGEWIWKDLTKSGKENPFSTDSIGSVNAASGAYDFYLSVTPDSADIPSIIVAKADDDSKVSFVYADSNAVEDVNFEFKTENNKYYFKYSTKGSSYPKDGTWLEFTPINAESINIRVFSSARNSKTDSAGVNIGVTNTSGMKARFEIEGDDKTNSRVYFKDAKTVIVTRK